MGSSSGAAHPNGSMVPSGRMQGFLRAPQFLILDSVFNLTLGHCNGPWGVTAIIQD